MMTVNSEFLKIQQIKFDLFKSQDPETGKFDVEFEIDGKKLYAHKTMLNLVSETFDSMISDRCKNNKNLSIMIMAYNFDDFYEFITFLYSAQCKLTKQNIFALVDMAEFYGVQIFKDYCEKYLLNMKYGFDEVFKLYELAIQNSLVQYNNYVKSIILVHGSTLLKLDSFVAVKKSIAVEVVSICKEKINAEELFQAVYKWSEKHVLEKQKSSNDPMFNLNNAIKSEICDFFPYIDFAAMSQDFLIAFVVARGFIFQSFDQLSQILINAKKECNVTKNEFLTFKVANEKGGFTGKIPSNDFAADYIKSIKNVSSNDGHKFLILWEGKYCIPPTPSSLNKKHGVYYYLVYDSFGRFGIKWHSESLESDYLIAEIFYSPLNCNSSPNYMIEICE